MTPEELAALARQAGLAALADVDNPMYANGRLLARFAALVAEHCARAITDRALASPYDEDMRHVFYDAADVVRSAFLMPKKDTPT